MIKRDDRKCKETIKIYGYVYTFIVRICIYFRFHSFVILSYQSIIIFLKTYFQDSKLQRSFFWINCVLMDEKERETERERERTRTSKLRFIEKS